LREAARPESNASRRKPQKRRLRGVDSGTWKEWRDLEMVAAEEEVAENESESEDCILKEERNGNGNGEVEMYGENEI